MSSYSEPVKIEVVVGVDDDNTETYKRRVTNPLLTKYEKARILGVRATQISKGAKPTIDIGDMKDALKIAEHEFKHGDIPLIIRRHLPDGGYEDWTLKEVIK